MSDICIIKHSEGITEIKFLVSPTYVQVVSIIDDIVENHPYEKRLWDLSEIQFNFTSSEIEQIAEYGKQKFTKPNRLALFALDDLAFGEMRQFMVYREEQSKALPRAFRNKQAAIEWLNSP